MTDNTAPDINLLINEEHFKRIQEAPELWWASLDWMKKNWVMDFFENNAPYINGTERQPWHRRHYGNK